MNIYADNAATAKMSNTAIEAMLPYMSEIYGNPSSLHTIEAVKDVVSYLRSVSPVWRDLQTGKRQYVIV